MNPRPLIFVDLDDTLFQTHRKSQPTHRHKIATTDNQGQPLSYMLPKQQIFVDWLIQTADVIPVTARSVEALGRVHLPFQQGSICSHGGTILDAQQQLDREWHERQSNALQQLKTVLKQLPEQLMDYAQTLGSIRTWTVSEYDLNIYTVAKQNTPEPLFLTELVQQLPQSILDHVYIHMNGNNLAIIPKSISKQNAVEFFISKYDPDNERAILGWGDSLSDAGFLSQCDWFGMPKHSQLDHFLMKNLNENYQEKGFFGHGA